MIIRQLGLAIGVLTSNRKGFATNFGGVHVGRHCWAPLLESRHAGVLLGAIAGSHCSMPFLGAIAGVPLPECHCWVPPYRGAAGCPIGLRVFCVGNGGFLLRGVGWGVFCDGQCWGFFATVLGGFFATVEGFLATARRVICISGGFLRR